MYSSWVVTALTRAQVQTWPQKARCCGTLGKSFLSPFPLLHFVHLSYFSSEDFVVLTLHKQPPNLNWISSHNWIQEKEFWVTSTGSDGAWRQQALCIRSQRRLFWCHPASLHFKFQDNNLKVVPRQNRNTGRTETHFKTKQKMHRQVRGNRWQEQEWVFQLKIFYTFPLADTWSSVLCLFAFFKHSCAFPSCYFLSTANCHYELASLLHFCPRLSIRQSSGSVRESSCTHLVPREQDAFATWCLLVLVSPSHPPKNPQMCTNI